MGKRHAKRLARLKETKKRHKEKKMVYTNVGYQQAGFLAKADDKKETKATPRFTKLEPKITRQPTLIAGTSVLRFTPYAWAKLNYLCHAGDTEIGGFGISAEEDPLLIEDIGLVPQTNSAATVEFDDEGVANFTNDMVERGYNPLRFLRIWIHTHPGTSASPSGTDINTFNSIFGPYNWSIMFILARGGETTAKMRINVAGVQAEVKLDVRIDWMTNFRQSNLEEWAAEYRENIRERTWVTYYPGYTGHTFKPAGHAGVVHDDDRFCENRWQHPAEAWKDPRDERDEKDDIEWLRGGKGDTKATDKDFADAIAKADDDDITAPGEDTDDDGTELWANLSTELEHLEKHIKTHILEDLSISEDDAVNFLCKYKGGWLVVCDATKENAEDREFWVGHDNL